MAETQAVAGAMHQIGSIAHTLLAAGDNDPGVAAADRLHRLLNRFQSGAAHQIDGDRRSVDRQAGPQRGLARRVLPAAGARNIIVVMTHASKNGESKLLPQCTLPLTGVGCIRRVLTDLALLEIVDGAFVLREVAPGVSPDEVIRKTAGRLIVADDVREMRFS